MTAVEDGAKEKGNGNGSALWTKVITGAAGALIIGMQSVNLSEVTQVGEQGRQRAEALKGIENSLENQAKILEGLETSINQNSEIITNGAQMLKHDTAQLDNQTKILDLLEKNLEMKQRDNSYPPHQGQ